MLGVAASGVLRIFQLRLVENLQQKIFTRASFEFAYRIPRIKMESLYKKYAPELMNRFFDTMTVQKGLTKLLIDISVASLEVLFGLILLSLYHPLFIIFSLILIILVYLIFKFTAKRGLTTSLKESKHKYEVAHWLEELARTNTSFKLSGETTLPLERVDIHTKDYLQARESHFKVLVQQYSILVFFKVIVAASLLILGGILVMEQVINIGQFVAAEIIILLIIGSVEKLILSLENIYDVLTALVKMGQVTDIELDNDEGIDLASECNDDGLNFELINVDFSYPDYPKKSLENLSLKVECGEKLLLVGSNGSGKTTLLHIIAGLYSIQSGNILYNKTPKQSIKMSSLRSIIGDCMTQGHLFEGTIFENISMGRKNATSENVKWAVENLKLNSFIQSLSNGLQTYIEPQGKKLPRSIIEKILMARSIADKPKLLLLEDAFEHIDGSERHEIIKFLTSEENKWTLVAVSADEYLASRVDKIVLLEHGTVIKIGDFDEMKSYID